MKNAKALRKMLEKETGRIVEKSDDMRSALPMTVLQRMHREGRRITAMWKQTKEFVDEKANRQRRISTLIDETYN